MLEMSLYEWWKLHQNLIGFEGEGGASTGDSEGEESEEEEEESSETEDDGKPDVDKLKSALKKERQLRRGLSKELRGLKQFKEGKETEENAEETKASKQLPGLKATNQKLAAALRKQAVEMAITRHASALNFHDPEDAVSRLWEKVEVDQDDDDPSTVDIDDDEVVDLLKDLAKKKPYLIRSESGKGEEETELSPSGSKFNQKRKTGTQVDDATLAARFPAMARRLAANQTRE